ncbi:ABC transport protein, ATP-binding subunit [hydrothermal vent metagenome]|uniref:ABC transport protein, ATP-binding subunit n=1 Tax=hydrothermal vent metagenome TaxID=652676 RepID=A0A3B0VHD1_9ZZZZ
MGTPIKEITIKGYKSIRNLEKFKLNPINILIGANGAGKSNFIDFFRLLHEIIEQRLQFTINEKGGADKHLFLGPKITNQLMGQVHLGRNGYTFDLKPTVDNRFVFFNDEQTSFDGNYADVQTTLGSGHFESNLKLAQAEGPNKNIAQYVYSAIAGWVIYHFHDTSETAAMRRQWTVRDNERLRSDAANLASFLWGLKQEHEPIYQIIRDTVQLVAPFFDDFLLRPQKSNGDEVVELEWRQKNSDYPFHSSQLSDGTLRFIALATALLQPNPPSTILLDEPELGLHPFALNILAGLIKQAAVKTQLIISTQSADLLDAFLPEDIIVVDRQDGESRFRRLSAEELGDWLTDEYSLGELWQKNVYGGSPAYE